MKVARRKTKGANARLGVRLRLTLLFGGLFLASGAALLAITYGLVNQATHDVVIQQSGGVGAGLGGAFISGSAAGGGPASTQQLQYIAARSAAGTQAAENDALLEYSGIALAAMAAVSIAFGWFAAGRALSPLRRITAAAQRIAATSLRERLRVDGPADDLRELADTIDGLFARLDACLDAQRQFVANASHELRTPLTRSRTLLEVALRRPDASADILRSACERAVAAAGEQERLIDALLTLARGQRGLARRDPVDLAAVTRDVLAARGAEITARGLAMDVTLAPALVVGDKALTERAVANLIDNALRHNGDDGQVWVSVRTTQSEGEGGEGEGGEGEGGEGGRKTAVAAVLSVANTGPPVPPGDIGRLLQPFQRREAGRAAARNGLGLGLSIVQAVATAHDAELVLASRQAGGLEAELVFPPAPLVPPLLPSLGGHLVHGGRGVEDPVAAKRAQRAGQRERRGQRQAVRGPADGDLDVAWLDDASARQPGERGPVGVQPERHSTGLARRQRHPGEPGQPADRARHLGHGVGQVQLNDLGARDVTGVAHGAGDLDGTVGRHLVRRQLQVAVLKGGVGKAVAEGEQRARVDRAA
jgi:signal transduction histidine kinase